MIHTEIVVTKDEVPVLGTGVHPSDMKDDGPQALAMRGDDLQVLDMRGDVLRLAEDLPVLDIDVHLSLVTDVVRPAHDTDAPQVLAIADDLFVEPTDEEV